jgi:hypothetical protein
MGRGDVMERMHVSSLVPFGMTTKPITGSIFAIQVYK